MASFRGRRSPIRLSTSEIGDSKPRVKIKLISVSQKPWNPIQLKRLRRVAIVIAAASASHHASMQRHQAIANRQHAAATATTISQLRGAEQAILAAKNSHEQGLLPATIDGNEITVGFEDAGGSPLAYVVYPDHVIVRSAGRDGRFGTGDDVTRRIAGAADEDRFILSPVAENPVAESETSATKSRRDRRASAR